MEYILLGLMVTAGVIAIVGLVMYLGQELIISWKREPNGYCPVQAEGWFLGYYFYFRSRYETAKIQFCKSPHDWDMNYITKEYILYTTKDLFEAGHIPHSKAKRLIYWGCFKFLVNRIIKNFKKAVK